MLLKCNAKINLGLNVTRKREDGFHEIESVFLPVPWNDELQIMPAEKVHFSSEGINIDGDSSTNLCMQAFHLLAADYLIPPVHIHLNKVIPIGAGLGGGSSDAAFVLKGLNELFQLNISIEKLEEYAAKLGSDCAFFIRNKPAFASGRGEVLEAIDFDLNGYVLLVNPNVHISTKEAYSKIKPAPALISLKNAVKQPLETWQTTIVNDFEKALLPSYPKLQKLKEDLLSLGANYVSMSGSGSTFFGIFKEKPTNYDFGDYQVMGFEC